MFVSVCCIDLGLFWGWPIQDSSDDEDANKIASEMGGTPNDEDPMQVDEATPRAQVVTKLLDLIFLGFALIIN
jgi:hypothetical protein